MRTADSTLFLCCPPGPLARYVCTSHSASSFASASLRTGSVRNTFLGSLTGIAGNDSGFDRSQTPAVLFRVKRLSVFKHLPHDFGEFTHDRVHGFVPFHPSSR